MNNKLLAALLVIPFVIIAGWILYYTAFTTQAQSVTLPIQGYDPRNFLSGHYIRFQIDWDKADCHQADWNGICPRTAFAGIDRFYVPEDRASYLEGQLNSLDTRTEIVFAFQSNKRPIAKQLLINGQPAF